MAAGVVCVAGCGGDDGGSARPVDDVGATNPAAAPLRTTFAVSDAGGSARSGIEIELSAEGAGSVAAAAATADEMKLFGDRLGSDGLGNRYEIFDPRANLGLEESAVWVLPAGRGELTKFLAASDRVFANIACGRGELGDGTVSLSRSPSTPSACRSAASSASTSAFPVRRCRTGARTGLDAVGGGDA
jgi:hypothetical protein